MLEPGRYYPGTSIRITINFEDENGNATDPSTVTFKTYSPSGVKATFVYNTDDEVQRTGVGAYHADIEPDEAGRWIYRWVTTGDVFATEGDFRIQDSPFFEPPISDYRYP